jgi:O-phosphoseryl-tRNA(Cys) synthetase
MEKIEEIIRNFAFALELGEDDVMRIMHIIEDSLDSDADYETIIDVLDEYNDGTTNFDDLCTEIYLELSNND